MVTGILIHSNWKASIISYLSVKETKLPFTNLEALLNAGFDIAVREGSTKGNFKFATSGPFMKAWQIMKENNESTVKDLDTGFLRVMDNPKCALFDTYFTVSLEEEYLSCLISAIPEK